MTQETTNRTKGKTMTTATKTKFSDRVRFNWGFHDATFDAERGKPKAVVDAGEQGMSQVSRTFDRFYADGYAQGLAAYRLLQSRPESSEPYWLSQTCVYQANGVAFTAE